MDNYPKWVLEVLRNATPRLHNSINGLHIERITQPRPLGHVEFPGNSVGVLERHVLLAESLVQFHACILDPGL